MHIEVGGFISLDTGFVAQRTRELTFIAPGSTGNQHIFSLAQVMASCKRSQLLFGKVACRTALNLVQGRWQTQLGLLQVNNGFYAMVYIDRHSRPTMIMFSKTSEHI